MPSYRHAFQGDPIRRGEQKGDTKDDTSPQSVSRRRLKVEMRSATLVATCFYVLAWQQVQLEELKQSRLFISNRVKIAEPIHLCYL